MKRGFLLVFILFLFASFLIMQCSSEEDFEDLYYEPLVEGIFNVEVDKDQLIKFHIEPFQPASVSGQFNNGIQFSLEFDKDALQFYEKVEVNISPIKRVENLPSSFDFLFGFVFTPEGIQFNNPGKIIIEMPSTINSKEFKGFFFEGGDTFGNNEAEIWNVKLTPITYKKESGKTYAVAEISHFSGFIGVSGGDFDCGNPLAADFCDDLKEVLACYIIGKDELGSDDLNKVNNALRAWLEEGIKWMEENPSELDESWEIDFAVKELLCWKSAALMFNSDLRSFGDILHRAGDLLTNSLINKLNEENNLCMAEPDMILKRRSFERNFSLLTLVYNLVAGAIIQDNINIDIENFCDGLAKNFYKDPFLDTTSNYISFDGLAYRLEFPKPVIPAVARSETITVYASNLLGEEKELVLGEDFTITLEQPLIDAFKLEGLTITEILWCCGENGQPGYINGYGRIYIVLNNSQDGINMSVTRAQ